MAAAAFPARGSEPAAAGQDGECSLMEGGAIPCQPEAEVELVEEEGADAVRMELLQKNLLHVRPPRPTEEEAAAAPGATDAGMEMVQQQQAPDVSAWKAPPSVSKIC